MRKSIAALATTLILPLSVQAAPLDTEQQQQVKQLVRDALMENPEILVEVINELKKKESGQREKAQKSALSASYSDLFNNNSDPVAGPEKALVSMVYFGDLNCGYCKRQDPILDKLVEKYPNFRVIYKDLPILGPSSREGAALALSAHKQNKNAYFTLHKRLISNPGKLSTDSITAAVKAEGLNPEKLKAGVNDSINRQLDDNIQLAQRLGITGTPALVFPDEILGGFTDEAALTAIIEDRLRTAKK